MSNFFGLFQSFFFFNLWSFCVFQYQINDNFIFFCLISYTKEFTCDMQTYFAMDLNLLYHSIDFRYAFIFPLLITCCSDRYYILIINVEFLSKNSHSNIIFYKEDNYRVKKESFFIQKTFTSKFAMENQTILILWYAMKIASN